MHNTAQHKQHATNPKEREGAGKCEGRREEGDCNTAQRAAGRSYRDSPRGLLQLEHLLREELALQAGCLLQVDLAAPPGVPVFNRRLVEQVGRGLDGIVGVVPALPLDAESPLSGLRGVLGDDPLDLVDLLRVVLPPADDVDLMCREAVGRSEIACAIELSDTPHSARSLVGH